jgi:hypothetical protein
MAASSGRYLYNDYDSEADNVGRERINDVPQRLVNE